MNLPSLEVLQEAAARVAAVVRPTPQICWPVLSARCKSEVWVKHENHTAIGAFKIRGALIFIDELVRKRPRPVGVVAATRGNHGRSVAFAARRYNLTAVIVVPHGNSVDQNIAIRAWGAELVEHGKDFQEALEYAMTLASDRHLAMIPSFHDLLVRGVASYPLEFFHAIGDLETLYVPIGLGSGICACIAAREAMGLTTKIVGVVPDGAPCYSLSFAARRAVPSESTNTMADGLAVRVPHPEAVEIINRFAERIVTVSETQIEGAIRYYFSDTHNVAEGAGAAALAGFLKEQERARSRKVGVILSGSNIERGLYSLILGSVPSESNGSEC
jgi:threonine dehydratase